MQLIKKLREFLIVPFRAREYSNQFFSGNLQLKMYNGENYADALADAVETYLPEQVKKDKRILRSIVTKAIKSRINKH